MEKKADRRERKEAAGGLRAGTGSQAGGVFGGGTGPHRTGPNGPG